MASPQIENGFLRIATELSNKFQSLHLSGYQWQILWVIMLKTYGFNKKHDMISISQFSKLTGILPHKIIESRNKLKQMKIIHTTQKGSRDITTYSIQKDYDKWCILPKKVVPKKVIPKKVKGSTQIGTSDSTQKGTNNKQYINNTIDSVVVIKTDHALAIEYFCNSYLEKTKTKYVFRGGKDGKLISELLKTMDLQWFKRTVDLFFKSSDKFIQEAGYTIGVFCSQINKLNKPDEEWR